MTASTTSTSRPEDPLCQRRLESLIKQAFDRLVQAPAIARMKKAAGEEPAAQDKEEDDTKLITDGKSGEQVVNRNSPFTGGPPGQQGTCLADMLGSLLRAKRRIAAIEGRQDAAAEGGPNPELVTSVQVF